MYLIFSFHQCSPPNNYPFSSNLSKNLDLPRISSYSNNSTIALVVLAGSASELSHPCTTTHQQQTQPHEPFAFEILYEPLPASLLRNIPIATIRLLRQQEKTPHHSQSPMQYSYAGQQSPPSPKLTNATIKLIENKSEPTPSYFHP